MVWDLDVDLALGLPSRRTQANKVIVFVPPFGDLPLLHCLENSNVVIFVLIHAINIEPYHNRD